MLQFWPWINFRWIYDSELIEIFDHDVTVVTVVNRLTRWIMKTLMKVVESTVVHIIWTGDTMKRRIVCLVMRQHDQIRLRHRASSWGGSGFGVQDIGTRPKTNTTGAAQSSPYPRKAPKNAGDSTSGLVFRRTASTAGQTNSAEFLLSWMGKSFQRNWVTLTL